MKIRMFITAFVAATAVAASARILKDVPYNPSLEADCIGDLYLPDEVKPEALPSFSGAISASPRSTSSIGSRPRKIHGRRAATIAWRPRSTCFPMPSARSTACAIARYGLLVPPQVGISSCGRSSTCRPNQWRVRFPSRPSAIPCRTSMRTADAMCRCSGKMWRRVR